MIEVIGYAIAALIMGVWALDVTASSEARNRLRDMSEMREVDRMADLCERYNLPLTTVETLTVGQQVRLNEAWRRLGYLLAPDVLARMMIPTRSDW